MAQQKNLIAQCARRRFEKRDWAGRQTDLVERIDLYEKSVVRALKKDLRPRVNEHSLWNDIRWCDGDTGLVMLVFKIIPDKFGFPKTIGREDVMEKYKPVSKHDRTGRLIDTQEFRNPELPRHRFSPGLPDDLLNETATG